MRKPLQGVWNIVRFNWHFYALSVVVVMGLFLFTTLTSNTLLKNIAYVSIALTVIPTIISLFVSCYIYDFSNLYSLDWLNRFISNPSSIVTINAGFDETSTLLQSKFPNSKLIVYDFYDPLKHTEISLKRARKAYPAYPNTIQINTNRLPLTNNSVDVIFAILSAHEIRNEQERITFFTELKRILANSGKIVVTEHQRDISNFFAYTIGFFHFHSKSKWLKTFNSSGLRVANEIKITPFISTFILESNGASA